MRFCLAPPGVLLCAHASTSSVSCACAPLTLVHLNTSSLAQLAFIPSAISFWTWRACSSVSLWRLLPFVTWHSSPTWQCWHPWQSSTLQRVLLGVFPLFI